MASIGGYVVSYNFLGGGGGGGGGEVGQLWGEGEFPRLVETMAVYCHMLSFHYVCYFSSKSHCYIGSSSK